MSAFKRYLLFAFTILIGAMLLQIGLNWQQVSALFVNTVSDVLSSLFVLALPILGIGILLKGFR